MKKKILFILHLPPPVHGSSVMGKHLRDSNIINKTLECRYINLNTSRSIKDIGKLSPYKSIKYVITLHQILKNLLFWKPGLCYIDISVNGNAFYKDFIIVTLVKIFNTKLIYHLHNKGVSLKQENILNDKLYRFVFNNSNVILLSKYLYSDVKKYVKENQVYYCPNGIPFTSFRDLKPKETEIVEILFLSNLSVSKGVFILLDAMNILNLKGINFKCTLVGSQGDIHIKKLEEYLAENKLNNKISYIGAMYGESRDSYYEKANIFILPTLNDCFPLVILEAMQNSLPVISTLEGGIMEMVDDKQTGFLIHHNDPYSLAEKIEILIKDNKLRSQMGFGGFEKYHKKFTLAIWENEMLKILEEVATVRNQAKK